MIAASSRAEFSLKRLSFFAEPAPHSGLLTPQAGLRPWPGIIALLPNNLLEFRLDRDYHRFVASRITP